MITITKTKRPLPDDLTLFLMDALGRGQGDGHSHALLIDEVRTYNLINATNFDPIKTVLNFLTA